MIVGFDSVKYKRGRRYVMAATYNNKYSKLFTKIRTNDDSPNVGPIGDMLNSCLNNFKKVNNIYPKWVLIYRSGTSEYEKKLFEHELDQIDDLITRTELKEIKYNYIHVNKKTELKFFEVENFDNQTKYKNPMSGLIVDSNIIHPDRYEFYIQPQFVSFNCGTATPVHYEVLHDSIELPNEELQSATFNLCFYYWNWSGPVRLPAPLKFAETCNGFSSKIDFEGLTHSKLELTPYYI